MSVCKRKKIQNLYRKMFIYLLKEKEKQEKSMAKCTVRKMDEKKIKRNSCNINTI